MKTKAIVATLLVAAAANVEAYFASPYPRKTRPPEERGHWIMTSDSPWSDDVESDPDAQRSSPARKEKTQLKAGMFHCDFAAHSRFVSAILKTSQAMLRRRNCWSVDNEACLWGLVQFRASSNT